jgi:Cdc6-like AAA superfamily ATPase
MEENGDLWFRKVGFFNNPFSIKPAPYDFRVVGQEELIDELTYKIPAGTMTFIEGSFGTGKSTVMKHLIHKFKGKGQVIFFSCNRIDNELNIEQLLKNKYGFWGKMFGMHPKNMILLLDEAQELTPENTERVKYFFDQGNLKSVVFAGVDYGAVKLHDSIKERIGTDGVMKVKAISEDEAITLIRNRIGSINLLSDELIKKLFEIAKGNPRRLLQKCDVAARHVVENGEQELTEEHFSKLFEEELKELKPKVEKKEVKKEAPKKKEVKKEAPKKKEVKKEAPKKKEVKEKEDPKKKEVKEKEDPEENLYDEK